MFVPGHTMKAHLEVALYLPAFLISTLDGDEWSILRFGRFVPGERFLSIHRMEGWDVDIWSGRFVEDRSFSPLSGIKRRFVGLPFCSLVTIPIMVFKLLQ